MNTSISLLVIATCQDGATHTSKLDNSNDNSPGIIIVSLLKNNQGLTEINSGVNNLY